MAGVAEELRGLPEDAATVQSRHLLCRVWDESIRLCCPDFADVVVGREAAQGLEPSGEGEEGTGNSPVDC